MMESYDVDRRETDKTILSLLTKTQESLDPRLPFFEGVISMKKKQFLLLKRLRYPIR